MSEPALKERLSQGFWLHRQSLPDEDHRGGPITLACHNQTCTQVIFADDKIEWNRFIVIPETIFSLSHFLIHFLVWVAVEMAHPELCLSFYRGACNGSTCGCHWSRMLQQKQKSLDRYWSLLMVCQPPWLGQLSSVHSSGPAPIQQRILCPAGSFKEHYSNSSGHTGYPVTCPALIQYPGSDFWASAAVIHWSRF